MYTIQNNQLKVTINPTGAELSSIYDKIKQREYLWSGDAKFWGKTSPVLFPIVGALKNNTYLFDGNSYELSRHGFAREMDFEVTRQTSTSLTFTLQNNEATLKVFPFYFSLSLIYTIEEKSLSVTYLVNNTGSEKMYFSVGAHPAFKLPLADGLAYDDYYLLFNKVENAGRWPISKDGLIEMNAAPLLTDTDRLPLTKELFYKDAVVFKNLQSDEMQLKSGRHTAGFSFTFKGFPYLGIWAAKDAPFVCIEPWCGIADSVNTNQQMTEKEGIIALNAGDNFERTWGVTLF